MSLKIGDSLPNSTFLIMTSDGPDKIDSGGFFAGRRIVLFSVPGAFTPACSARHLPGFIDHADEIMAKGIDAIACTAVNDIFVLDAWGKGADASNKVAMLSDGNGEFVAKIGLANDLSAYGMGVRGERFSMIVNNGIVEQINVENPGEFNVSSAEYLIDRL